MEKLLVKKIEDDKYILIDENNNLYEFTLTFFGLDKKLAEGTKILMHKNLLDPKYEEYSQHYYFGPLDEPYGREVTKESVDFIAIKTEDAVIKLKRFFG